MIRDGNGVDLKKNCLEHCFITVLGVSGWWTYEDKKDSRVAPTNRLVKMVCVLV